MQYVPPVGGAADDPYVDANPALGVEGSMVPAAAIEHVQREVIEVIEAAGLVPTSEDLTQLLQAIQALVVQGNTLPIGTCIPWPTEAAPVGWLERNGSLLSMTSYESLYNVLGTMYGKDVGVTCTFTNGTDVVNKAGHGLANGTVLELSNSGGALPTGLAAATKYYVRDAAADTYKLAATPNGAAIDFTTDGTGTSKYHVQFKLMDDRGIYDSYWDNGAGMDPDAATRTDRGDGTTGDHVGTYQADEIKSHTHSYSAYQDGAYGHGAGTTTTDAVAAKTTGGTGGNATRPRNRTKMAIIKAYIA